MLSQAEAAGAPNLADVAAGVFGRFDEVIGAAVDEEQAGSTLVSTTVQTVARQRARQLVPPGSVTIDLRSVDVDYRIKMGSPGIVVDSPGKCVSGDAGVDVMLTTGVAFVLERLVDAGDLQWTTTYSARPWVGMDPAGCFYTGATATVDLPPPDLPANPLSIIPNFDAESWGPCNRTCPRELVEPVAATVEELVETGVAYATRVFEGISEWTDDLLRRLPSWWWVALVGLGVLVVAGYVASLGISFVNPLVGGTSATVVTVGAAGALAVLFVPAIARQLPSPSETARLG